VREALPGELVERARSIAAGEQEWQVPPTRDAATVVLMRDTAEGIEVFLMRRVRAMAFAAGMHVFPGGALDPDDRDVPVMLPAGLDAGWHDRRIRGSRGLGPALLAAAARETFEECGVLLVRRPDDAAPGAALDLVTDYDRWEPRRRSLLDGDRLFSDLLRGDGLVVDGLGIRPWTHWVTPEFEERRYDTRFFVAALPDGQQARDLGGEADRVHWARPGQALEQYRGGGLAMLPPTVDTLTSLLAFGTAAEVLAAADQREIRPLMPRPRADQGGVSLADLQWVLVDATTGEVLDEMGGPPAGSESRGVGG